MQNMQNQQLDEFGNPIQQQPVQAPNPMMPNRAGAPPRSMNDLVYQPLSNQGSMAYQKVKTPTKGGIGSVGNRLSGDALREKIYDDVEKEREKLKNQGKVGEVVKGHLSPGHPDYIPPENREKPGTPRFSDTKKLSDSTLEKMREGNYDNDNEPKKQSLDEKRKSIPPGKPNLRS